VTNLKKYTLLCLLNVILTLPLTAQNEGSADMLMQGNKLAAVVVVLLVILAGIVVYLVAMERRIRRLED
jgi:uncharacterized integral membrane protein